jgi:peptidoglycan/xylan/chitin deacetylase (PgdA/CDA1 family)
VGQRTARGNSSRGSSAVASTGHRQAARISRLEGRAVRAIHTRAAQHEPAGLVRDILVLCYHGVSETWPAAVAVTPANLESQLSLLVGRGYRGSTFCEALTAPRHERTLVVTFDDAFRSVLTQAFPILNRLGLPATVFAPTVYPDSDAPMAWAGYERWLGTSHEQELKCLSWDELRTLRGVDWEIGSHTCSHPRLTTLDDTSLMHELRVSREKCEYEMNEPCYSLAYPYSDYDSRVVRATRQAGYALAATVGVRSSAPLPLQWPRVVVDRKDSATLLRFRAWRRATPLADAAWRSVAPSVRRPPSIVGRLIGRRQ